MKKLLLIPILCTHTLYAQTFIGPEFGMNTSNLKMSGPFTTYKNRLSTNFRVGAVLSVNGDRKIVYHIGLNYYGKGSNIAATNNGQQYASHLVIHSLQLPVYASIQSRPGRYGRFFLGAGAFVDCHLAGKTYAGTADGKTITIGNHQDINYMDGGMALQGGYRVNDGISLRLQYQLGLANLSSLEGQSIKSRSFGVTVAYMGRSGVPKVTPVDK